MRLVDPVRGSVVETTDPRTIANLIYGRGYWNVDDDGRTSTHTPATGPEIPEPHQGNGSQ